MKRKKLFTKKEFNEIYRKVPRITVDVLFRKDNKFLLIKRTESPYINKWHIPGGTVFIHERLKETVKRISMEELGIEVEIKKFLGYEEFMKEGIGRHAITLVFEVTGDGKPKNGKLFKKIPHDIIREQGIFLQNL